MAEEEVTELVVGNDSGVQGWFSLVTMHLVVCLQMPSMMVGIDPKDLALHILQRTQVCA